MNGLVWIIVVRRGFSLKINPRTSILNLVGRGTLKESRSRPAFRQVPTGKNTGTRRCDLHPAPCLFFKMLKYVFDIQRQRRGPSEKRDGLKAKLPRWTTNMRFNAAVALFQARAAVCVCAFKKVNRSTFNSSSVRRVCAGKRRGKRIREEVEFGERETRRERDRARGAAGGRGQERRAEIDIWYSGSSERRLDFFCFIVIPQPRCGRRGALRFCQHRFRRWNSFKQKDDFECKISDVSDWSAARRSSYGAQRWTPRKVQTEFFLFQHFWNYDIFLLFTVIFREKSLRDEFWWIAVLKFDYRIDLSIKNRSRRPKIETLIYF